MTLAHLPAIELKPLADLSRDEILRVLAIRNEDGVRRFMYTCHLISEAEHFAWVERTMGDQSVRFYALLRGPEIIGATTLMSIDRTHRRAEWGAYLGKAYHGRGLGKAMEVATLDLAFGELGLEKVNGEMLSFNEAALRCHLRLGFVVEGVRRRHILRDGEWVDVTLVGITRENWMQTRAALAVDEAA